MGTSYILSGDDGYHTPITVTHCKKCNITVNITVNRYSLDEKKSINSMPSRQPQGRDCNIELSEKEYDIIMAARGTGEENYIDRITKKIKNDLEAMMNNVEA